MEKKNDKELKEQLTNETAETVSSSEEETTREQVHPFGKENGVTDLILEVGKEKYYVNRGILVSCSPVFKSMLVCEKPEIRKLKLDDDAKEFLTFLESLYPSVLAPVTMTTIDTVLKLADKYKINSLMTKCDLTMKDYFQRSVDGSQPGVLNYSADAKNRFFRLINNLKKADDFFLQDALSAGIDVISRYNCRCINSLPLTNGTKLKIYDQRVNRLEDIVCKFYNLRKYFSEMKSAKNNPFLDVEALMKGTSK